MYGYGGMGHYFARQHYDKRCTNCSGTGREEFPGGFIEPCATCHGSGLRPDPRLTWSDVRFMLALLVIVGGVTSLVLYGVGMLSWPS